LLSWEPSLLPKCAYFGDLRSHAPWFLDALSSTVSTILIAIGPESGFTQKEVSHMEQALHMQGVLLHHNVLRTDTATITALSLASHYHLCHNSQCK
jgi:16S rRNA (uracil1498-N3)-methyltransferase